ncbi:hypothetical protein D3C78_1736810 [compost metagenome]
MAMLLTQKLQLLLVLYPFCGNLKLQMMRHRSNRGDYCRIITVLHNLGDKRSVNL